LAPLTMIAGDLSRRDSMAIVGFEGFSDFYPGLIAENLSAQGFAASEIKLDIPSLNARRLRSPIHLAQLFEQEKFRQEVCNALRGRIGTAKRVGFPAILGIDDAVAIQKQLEDQLGCPVFEIPSLPPSIPGIRLHNVFMNAIKKSGGRIFNGMEVTNVEVSSDVVRQIQTEAAARSMNHRANNFVLASGGILGGGITANQFGVIEETIFHLPSTGPASRTDWFSPQFLNPYGHPVFISGVVVNPEMKPIDHNDRTLYLNLQAAGTILAGGDFLREMSMDGVDLASAYSIVRSK
jgi:glycerol-3-phosphate dehydrogenase subunit B